MQKGPVTCLESHGGTARPGPRSLVLPEVMVCRVPGMCQALGTKRGQKRGDSCPPSRDRTAGAEGLGSWSGESERLCGK